MKTAYLQCVGGVSGDMLLGALVDVGVPLDDISAMIDEARQALSESSLGT